MLNRCEFIGNLGADPEIRSLQNGDKVANLRLACTERWKSKDGEQRERTEWITVVIWGALSGVAERYLRKGSKVYVAGKWTTRKWTDQSGQDRYSTECVLQGFDGEFYRIETAYGLLTVDAQGVICEGPACPDLTAPKAVIRLVGAPDAGARLLPGLFRAFAAARGVSLRNPCSSVAVVVLRRAIQPKRPET